MIIDDYACLANCLSIFSNSVLEIFVDLLKISNKSLRLDTKSPNMGSNSLATNLLDSWVALANTSNNTSSRCLYSLVLDSNKRR